MGMFTAAGIVGVGKSHRVPIEVVMMSGPIRGCVQNRRLPADGDVAERTRIPRDPLTRRPGKC